MVTVNNERNTTNEKQCVEVQNIMKTKTLLPMGLCAAIALFVTQTFAADSDRGDHKDAHAKVKVPDALPDILKEIHKHHDELAGVVKSNRLSEVHHHAFAIRDLAKALPAKSPPDHKKHIENLVKKISQIAPTSINPAARAT
jgi:hypothetical protein